MSEVAIIDIGFGNISSLENMINRIGYKATLVNNKEELNKFKKIILPGVGSFDNAMESLNEKGLSDKIKELSNKNIHILGICLGMQLLFESSEEGKLKGLGLIKGKVIGFNFKDKSLKIPHMGWNEVFFKKESRLTHKLPLDSRFYFIHSFYCDSDNKEDKLFSTSYGLEFDSAIEKDNLFGVQFHPEKSHKFGMQLLKNFMEIEC